jgi:putative salt-induced outer membrane protein
MEIGIGYRRNQPTPTATTSADEDSPEEIISRLAEHYDVVLTDSTKFFQDLLIESGDSNTTSELGLGLKVDMNDSVALQLSYNVKRNSNPPDSGDPDDPTVKTDRTMRLSLVFGF